MRYLMNKVSTAAFYECLPNQIGSYCCQLTVQFRVGCALSNE